LTKSISHQGKQNQSAYSTTSHSKNKCQGWQYHNPLMAFNFLKPFKEKDIYQNGCNHLKPLISVLMNQLAMDVIEMLKAMTHISPIE